MDGPTDAGPTGAAASTIFLKPRGASAPVPWQNSGSSDEELAGSTADPTLSLDEVEFVALDVETTGNSPFLVLEIGAERFDLRRPL